MASSRNPIFAAALLLSLLATGVHADFPAFPFASIPSCVSDCVQQSGCNVVNLRCMCDASRGRFLPEVAACIRRGCGPPMSVNTLLDPLESNCNMMGAPIPSAAISSAQSAASSSGGVDATATMGEPSAVPKPPPRTTETATTSTEDVGASVTSTLATTTTATASSTNKDAGASTAGPGTETTAEATTATDTTAPTSTRDTDPSAPPESGGRSVKAPLLGASVGILAMLAMGC